MRPPTGAASARKGGDASSSDRRSRRRSSSPPSARRAAPSPARRAAPSPARRSAPSPARRAAPSPNRRPSASFSPNPAARLAPPPYGFHNLDPASAAARPAPTYGFHNLDRRTAVLADGSVRSYFALPQDYSNDPLPRERFLPGPEFGQSFPPRRFSPNGFREPPPFLRDPRGLPEDDFLHRQHLMSYGSPNAAPSGSGGVRVLDKTEDPRSVKHAVDDLPPQREEDGAPAPALAVAPVGVDGERQALKRAFLKFVKIINENATKRNTYLADGKKGPLKCIVCDRSSKEFSGVRALVNHAYYAQNADRRVDHLGLHKALCVLMGWDYAPPENSKAYELLSDDDIVANRKDLILWPPTVIIHNTSSGQKKDGRMVGLGNKDMDTKLQELGFAGGKSKAVYGKEGHTGVMLVKFANTQAGLKEAERLAEHFEKESHGLEAWVQAQASKLGDDNENPALVNVDDKSGEKKRIFYGYMATASDFEKVDVDTKRKAVVKSRKEFDL